MLRPILDACHRDVRGMLRARPQRQLAEELALTALLQGRRIAFRARRQMVDVAQVTLQPLTRDVVDETVAQYRPAQFAFYVIATRELGSDLVRLERRCIQAMRLTAQP